jgi:chromosomal replication initiation ATPase DnaA
MSARLDELYSLRSRITSEIAAEVARIEAVARRERERLYRVRPVTRGLWNAVVDASAAETGIPRSVILGRSRHPAAAYARHVACWVACERGLSYSEVGRLLGRDHSTVRHSVMVVADDFDALEVARLIGKRLRGGS